MRTLFIVQIAAGLLMLAIAIFFVPMMPHTLLDVVLSPSELQDPSKIDETLLLLQAGNGWQTKFWVAAGLLTICSSGAGLWLTRTPSNIES
jgi:hypothetical protein